MHSTSESYTLRKLCHVWFVRFRHGGHRYELSTGCRERDSAERAAAVIFSKLTSGDWQKAEPVCVDARPGLHLHRTGVVNAPAERLLGLVRDALSILSEDPAFVLEKIRELVS